MNYNLSYLREISGGDELFVKNIVTEFVTNAPRFLDQINVATAKADWSLVRSLVHQFAPQLDFIGMNETRFLADQLEDLSKNTPDQDLASELAARIFADCKLVIENLKSDFQI